MLFTGFSRPYAHLFFLPRLPFGHGLSAFSADAAEPEFDMAHFAARRICGGERPFREGEVCYLAADLTYKMSLRPGLTVITRAVEMVQLLDDPLPGEFVQYPVNALPCHGRQALSDMPPYIVNAGMSIVFMYKLINGEPL